MAEMERAGGAGRFVKLGLIGLGGAVAGLVAYFCVEQTPQVVWLKGAVGLLVGLEVAYGVAVVGGTVGVPVLAAVVVRGRKRGVKRAWAAKVLALAVSVLMALAVGEGAAAVVRAKRGRQSAVPVGGFGRDARNRPASRPDATEDVVLPTEFPDAKGPNDVDIVVLGESSAAGVPYSLFSLSPGAIVTWVLGQEVPGKTFHLNVLAATGDTLEGQHRLLAGLKRKPDVVVVYCGHNEFSARLPESRGLDYYLDAGEPTPWQRFVERVEEVSPFCGLVRSAADTCRVAIPPPPNGNRQLVDTPVYSRAEYDALLGDFRRRLGAIVAWTETVGALPVLVTPPANDADFEPSRSFLPPETKRADREAFAREVEAVRGREASDPEGSAKAYRALIARYPGFAETHFRLARLQQRAGAWDEAYRHYVEARDADGLPMRCPTAFQQVYRDLAAPRRAVLIDGQTYFHAVGWHGLLDDHTFHDGMHPSLLGQSALAEAILRALHARKAFGWPEGRPAPAVDPADLARRFALGKNAWNKLCHWGIMFYDKTAPARFDPSERRAKQDAFAKAAVKILGGTPPEKVGLPNVGVPDSVPAAAAADSARRSGFW